MRMSCCLRPAKKRVKPAVQEIDQATTGIAEWIVWENGLPGNLGSFTFRAAIDSAVDRGQREFKS